MVYSDNAPIPPSRVLDFLSSQRDLNIAMLNELKDIRSAILSAPFIDKQSLKNALIGGQYSPYQIKKIALDTAQTDVPLAVEGTSISWAVTGGQFTGLSIRLNSQQSDSIPLDVFKDWQEQFFQLFVTNNAQAGAVLYLIIGRDGAVATSAQRLYAQDVLLRGDFAAVVGVDKNFEAFNGNVGVGGTASLSYTVTAGKTLYITQVAFVCEAAVDANKDLPSAGGLSLKNDTLGIFHFRMGGVGGGGMGLAKPVVFTTGQTMIIYTHNWSDHACACYGYALGYEL